MFSILQKKKKNGFDENYEWNVDTHWYFFIIYRTYKMWTKSLTHVYHGISKVNITILLT